MDHSSNPPKVVVPITLPENYKYGIPKYATEFSSGFDLCADIEAPIQIGSSVVKISTGLRMAVPPGFELQIRTRSGLACKGIVVANSPGTCDADFRGVISVLLINLSKDEFSVDPGMKIAQGVICPVYQARFQQVSEDQLGKTGRGEGGFGSTGL